jgi:hypothetical protein
MQRDGARNGARIGTLAGMALGAVFLVVISVVLVRPADSSYRALIAVWLWALPALGVFGCLGWLAGRLVDVFPPFASVRSVPSVRSKGPEGR